MTEMIKLVDVVVSKASINIIHMLKNVEENVSMLRKNTGKHTCKNLSWTSRDENLTSKIKSTLGMMNRGLKTQNKTLVNLKK